MQWPAVNYCHMQIEWETCLVTEQLCSITWDVCINIACGTWHCLSISCETTSSMASGDLPFHLFSSSMMLMRENISWIAWWEACATPHRHCIIGLSLRKCPWATSYCYVFDSFFDKRDIREDWSSAQPIAFLLDEFNWLTVNITGSRLKHVWVRSYDWHLVRTAKKTRRGADVERFN